MTTQEETLKTYTGDLLAVEEHFLNAVKKQKSSSIVRDEEAIDLLNEIDKTLSLRTEELRKHADRIGADTKTDIKKAIASFAGSIAGLIDTVRDEPVSKIIRDDYVALSILAIGYTMLHTAAMALEDQPLQELSQNHLGDITQLVTETSRVAPVIVARELLDDKEKADELSKTALDHTQELWSGEHIKSGINIV